MQNGLCAPCEGLRVRTKRLATFSNRPVANDLRKAIQGDRRVRSSTGARVIIDEHRGPILAIALELYGRAVYSHETHEQERERWSRQVQWMNWIKIGLAGATTFA